jgi:hypothetical protein
VEYHHFFLKFVAPRRLAPNLVGGAPEERRIFIDGGGGGA